MKNIVKTLSRKSLERLVSGLAGKTGFPLVFTDMEGNRFSSDPPPGGPTAAKAPSRQVPVRFKGETIGNLSGNGRGKNGAALLNMAAYCMENSFHLETEMEDLTSEIVRVYQELSLIYSLSDKLGSALEISSICQQALEEISKAIAVKTIVILLLDDRSGMLDVQSCTGVDREMIGSMKVDASAEPFAGIFSRMRATVIQADPEENPLPFPLQAALCVPLVTDNKHIGMLIARDKSSGEKFRSQEIKLVDALAGEIAAAIKKAQLYDRIKRLFINTVEALASAIDAKDPYTYGHSRRVAQISASICREIGMSREEIHSVELAALLHDIGKIGTPEHILQKPGRLKPEEIEIIKEHPAQGAQILSTIDELKDVMAWIKNHHERYDGKGYPDRYMAEEIPLPSRIISIADSFDAMTSDRPYRKGMDPAKVVDIMDDLAGIQYDPHLLKAFKAVFLQQGIKFT